MIPEDVAARRARLRALQAPREPPYDWRGLAQFCGAVVLTLLAFSAVVVVFAGTGGSLLDWLTGLVGR